MTALGATLAVLLWAAPAPARAPRPRPPKVPTFEQAYQRERASLLSERKALKKQLEALTQANAAKQRTLEADVRALTQQVAARRKSAISLEGRLTAARERLTAQSDQSDQVEANLDVAIHSLRKLGIRVPEAMTVERRLELIFTQAIDALGRFGTVHVRPGKFFGPDNVEVAGRIVHIGRVAALGVAGDVGGVLVRVPNGGLKVSNPAARSEAKTLASGGRLTTTPIHLLSPSGKPTRLHHKPGFWDQLRAGGIIAWIIVGLALFALLIILERVVVLLWASNRAERLFGALRQALATGRIDEAQAVVRRRGALARVLQRMLAQREADREHLDEVAAEAVLQETPRLERLLPVLGVAAAVAPLLGLLGTVTGMISTFRVITEHGTGDPRLLSGGISEALITTEFGLAVAIPVLLIHTVLLRWSDRIADQMQSYAMALINLLKAPDFGEGASAQSTETGQEETNVKHETQSDAEESHAPVG
jgi:biopolymer transport protein ExbB